MAIHQLAIEELSQAARFQQLPKRTRKARLAKLSHDERYALQYNWSFWRRPKQVIPKDKRIVLMRPGRGWGKTRVISEWVRERWKDGYMSRAVLVADTPKDARQYNVLGKSGLLKVHPHWERPRFKPSETKLIWPLREGQHEQSELLYFSAEDPDSLRGMNADTVVIDELAKSKKQDEVMEQVDLVLREGRNLRVLIGTTPKPTPLIIDLIENRKDVHVIGGSSFENTALNEDYFKTLEDVYAGTYTGRQEVFGELLKDNPDALWKQKWFHPIDSDDCKLEYFDRIVLGVDPSGAAEKDQNPDRPNATGLIVAGRLRNSGHAVVLDNMSAVMGADEWSAKAAHLYDKWKCDRVIAEINYGGDMVRFVLQSKYPNMPVEVIHVSRGKHLRAAPVAMLYEQEKVYHRKEVNEFGISLWAILEEQCLNMTPSEFRGRGSPDELDAMVFALTELMISGRQPITVY